MAPLGRCPCWRGRRPSVAVTVAACDEQSGERWLRCSERPVPSADRQAAEHRVAVSRSEEWLERQTSELSSPMKPTCVRGTGPGRHGRAWWIDTDTLHPRIDGRATPPVDWPDRCGDASRHLP